MWHQGSGATVTSVMSEALDIEAKWKAKSLAEGLTTRLPTYQRTYDSFVKTCSTTFADSVNRFHEAKSLGHTLMTYKVFKEFEDWTMTMTTRSRSWFLVLGGAHNLEPGLSPKA